MSLTKAIKRGWLARLGLTFSHSVHGTQLARTKRVGPLSIQKAFYPEGRDCAHIYLLHPPAGIVSGDVLQVDLHLPPQYEPTELSDHHEDQFHVIWHS